MSNVYNILTFSSCQKESDWFDQLSELLLNQTEFIVNGKVHRFLEIEYYLHSREHPDPFVHCNPAQKNCGKWYFHSEGNAYRGGSFKGLDISFSTKDDFAGILIRTIIDEEDNEINGCSLAVDHLLEKTGYDKVSELDGNINNKHIFDDSSPIYIRFAPTLKKKNIVSTARVGLTLKRMSGFSAMPEYILRPYRYLTNEKIKKGKEYTIMALHQTGMSTKDIQFVTGSTKKSIEGYKKEFMEGKKLDSFDYYQGKSLKTADICKMHGTWNTCIAT